MGLNVFREQQFDDICDDIVYTTPGRRPLGIAYPTVRHLQSFLFVLLCRASIIFFFRFSTASGKASIKNGKTFVRLKHFFGSRFTFRTDSTKKLIERQRNFRLFELASTTDIYRKLGDDPLHRTRYSSTGGANTPSKLVVQIIMAEIYFRWRTFL